MEIKLRISLYEFQQEIFLNEAVIQIVLNYSMYTYLVSYDWIYTKLTDYSSNKNKSFYNKGKRKL